MKAANIAKLLSRKMGPLLTCKAQPDGSIYHRFGQALGFVMAIRGLYLRARNSETDLVQNQNLSDGNSWPDRKSLQLKHIGEHGPSSTCLRLASEMVDRGFIKCMLVCE